MHANNIIYRHYIHVANTVSIMRTEVSKLIWRVFLAFEHIDDDITMSVHNLIQDFN